MPNEVDKVNQSPVDAADEVFEAIHALMHLYRSRQYQAQRDGGSNELTHQETKALGFFSRRPGATQGDLIARSGQDKGQIARLVAGLKDRGLLEARPDAQDRRVFRLTPTPAGRRLQASLRERGRELAEASLMGLGDDERQQLMVLIGRLRANLEGSAAGDETVGVRRRGRS